MRFRRHLYAATLAVAALLVAACGPDQARDPTGPEVGSPLVPQAEPGDILVSINGQPVRSRAQAQEMLRTPDADGGPWRIVIDRKGERIVFYLYQTP